MVRSPSNPGELPPGEVIVRIPGAIAPAIGECIRAIAPREKLQSVSADGRQRIDGGTGRHASQLCDLAQENSNTRVLFGRGIPIAIPFRSLDEGPDRVGRSGPGGTALPSAGRAG